VEERLPESNVPVLCRDKYNNQYQGTYTDGSGDLEAYDADEERVSLSAGWYECEEQTESAYDEVWIERIVTHWMPKLPSPPSKTKEA
jgi:hypothetical protein